MSRAFSENTDFEIVQDGLGNPVGRLLHRCPECGEGHVLDVDPRKLERWAALDRRPHVQDYWPELTPAEREEYFMSGICGRCWDETFKEDGDEEK